MRSTQANSVDEIRGVRSYVWNRGVTTPIGLIVATVVLGVTLWAVESNSITSIVDWVGIVAGILTLIVVWFLDRRREWIDSIEKRATFTYWYWSDNGWHHWRTIQDVFLAAEGDVRNWSQSLGGQLKDGDTFLPLDAHVHVTDWNPSPAKAEGDRWVRRFDVHTPLWMHPDEYERSMMFKSALYEERPEGSAVMVRKEGEFEKLLVEIRKFNLHRI